MDLQNWVEQQPEIASNLLGTCIEGYVRVKKLYYPKEKDFEALEFMEPAILQVELEDLIAGEIPIEFNKSYRGKSEVVFTIKGRVPKLKRNTSYHFIGRLVSSKYGYEYDIEELSSLHNLEDGFEFNKFLVGVVGESRAKLLSENLEDPLKVLKEGDLETLKSIKGLGDHYSALLLSKYQENFKDGIAYAKLATFGLSMAQASKIVANFKSLDTAIEVLSKNPYKLIYLAEGFGWQKADNIALNAGIDPCGEIRLKAYVEWFLRGMANEGGNSWANLEQVAMALHSIAYNLKDSELIPMMQEWIDPNNPKYFLHYDRPTNRIGLDYLWKVENMIAEHLLRIKHSNVKEYQNEEIEAAIKESEEEVGFNYTEEQKKTIYSCLQNSITLIRGSAGSGKSSIMRPICKVLQRDKQVFAQCSLSGKAASNLSEMTNQEGQTIHRLLRWNPENKTFGYNLETPLPLNMVILDEISLVGIDVFLSLISAIPSDCRLIMLGDDKQLESIGVGNLIKDLPNSEVINTCLLTKIHRQAARSGIISESLRISAGESLCSNYAENEVRGELKDLKVITYTESSLTAPTILEEFDKLFFERNIPINDISIVLPLKGKGAASCYAINLAIQERINKISSLDDIVITKEGKSYTLHEGDKIIIKKNNYEVYTLDGKKEAIFNGNVGFYMGKGTISMKKKNAPSEEIPCMIVELLQQGRIKIPLEEKSCVELGYAITCHSAQGSGSPYVIVGMDIGAYTLLSREWVYTALTRAKKECILVSQISALQKAAKISRVSVKHTWLRELLVNKEQEFQSNGGVLLTPFVLEAFKNETNKKEAKLESD